MPCALKNRTYLKTHTRKRQEKPAFKLTCACVSKPMVPFWGGCTTHFSLFKWGCSLGVRDFYPWPCELVYVTGRCHARVLTQNRTQASARRSVSTALSAFDGRPWCFWAAQAHIQNECCAKCSSVESRKVMDSQSMQLHGAQAAKGSRANEVPRDIFVDWERDIFSPCSLTPCFSMPSTVKGAFRSNESLTASHASMLLCWFGLSSFKIWADKTKSQHALGTANLGV